MATDSRRRSNKSTSGCGLPDFQGFRTGTRLQDTIAKAFEEETGDRAQGFFIFDQQDGFVAAGRLGLRRPVVQSRAGTFQGREVDSECGADADLMDTSIQPWCCLTMP